MEAYSHLTEWKSLQYCSTVNIDETTPPDLEKMWSEAVYQVTEGYASSSCSDIFGFFSIKPADVILC